MKSYPLKSLTIAEAQEMQFRLVDEITKVFPGNEILTRGDLGVVKGINHHVFQRKGEKVIANFFEADEALLVRGSGTNAIRLALHAGVDRKKCLEGTILVLAVAERSLKIATERALHNPNAGHTRPYVKFSSSQNFLRGGE